MTAPWTILGVPIDSIGAPAGGPPVGTEQAPRVLRERGVVARLGGTDAGDVTARITGPDRDAATGLVGGTSVAATTTEIRRRTTQLLAEGARPLLLGGCCALLPGALAAARDVLGRVGLVHVDGHLDLYDHRTSPTGEAADLPVAWLLGVGEPGLLAATSPTPVLDAGDLMVLGARDADERRDVAELVVRFAVRDVPPDDIARDPAGTASAAAAAVTGTGTGPFWLHLDVDVLDETEFPATDYLMRGGLRLDDLRELLRPLGHDPRLVGFSLGCYNPEKDPAGSYAAVLCDALVDVLGPTT